jgi:hypothetical protein
VLIHGILGSRRNLLSFAKRLAQVTRHFLFRSNLHLYLRHLLYDALRDNNLKLTSHRLEAHPREPDIFRHSV